MGNISQTPGQPPPWALYDGEMGTFASGALSANTAYLTGVYLPGTAVLTGLRMRFATGGNGNYDIGIYDSNGVLLASRGSTASATGVQTYTLGTPLALAAGRYWLAFWTNNATDSITKSGPNTNLGVCQSGGTTGPLPANMSSLASLANSSNKVLIMGLLQGGWS